jgi:endonuclease/exonuclease/phosphatase family metal-dependent hydrolase
MDFLYGTWCKLTTSINKQPINKQQTNKSIENNEIRIVSYNIKALFPFYNKRRIKDLVNYIEKLFIERKTDIVCLQEAFELDLYNQLYEVVAKNRLNIVHPPLERSFVVGENSGLVTISRFNVSSCKFIRYEQAAGLCRFANKGAHYMTVDIGGKSLRLVNTHLQSDNETIAINQFGKLIDNTNGALIVGDMNMKYDTVSKKLGHVVSVNSTKEITFPETGDQLDYFLLYNLDLKCSFSVLSDVELSDHYPILTTFVFP